MTNSIPAVQDLGDVYLLDTYHRGIAGTIGVFLLPIEGGAFTLVESGPGSTVERVEAGIRELGFDLEGLEHLLLTHIHLDHAGAAGELARRSGALVHVHQRGASHLADPSRLMESAGRIYGDAMDELWGEMVPVPSEQLRSHYDGDVLELGGHRIEVLDTPGHASHHAAYLLDDDTIFTGDAAGVRFPPATLIRPALPPPEIDLEQWDGSIAKLRSCVPERLLLTHFGEVRNADEHLSELSRRNRAWADEVRRGMLAGEELDQLQQRIRILEEREFAQAGLDEQMATRYRVTSDAGMTGMGLQRYWRKKRPEEVARD
ncbi:MAG TPA: MBL fold metallo-hydrolase [Trueperaceae bacterium]